MWCIYCLLVGGGGGDIFCRNIAAAAETNSWATSDVILPPLRQWWDRRQGDPPVLTAAQLHINRRPRRDLISSQLFVIVLSKMSGGTAQTHFVDLQQSSKPRTLPRSVRVCLCLGECESGVLFFLCELWFHLFYSTVYIRNKTWGGWGWVKVVPWTSKHWIQAWLYLHNYMCWPLTV